MLDEMFLGMRWTLPRAPQIRPNTREMLVFPVRCGGQKCA
jgi:hypothetical protein